MPNGKDTRIVQMQFDNKSFERNIATSQKSLDRFKKSLNFDETARGLRSFADSLKNMAFDTVSTNLQRLTDKFTGLGNAGEYVISRIRRGLEDLALQAENVVKSLTFDQISVGQSKYDALTKAVQTIVATGKTSEEDAYAIMERLMVYTDQTSHSFQTMAGQITSLTSIGVPLETAEKMMEGFANASTKAGADAEHAATAMITYAKAMGSFLTKQEFDTLNLTARVVDETWREKLIEAGIAAKDLVKDASGKVKTASKYGKQVEVTMENLESTLNKKWASKGTLTLFSEFFQFGETIEELQHPEDAMDSFGKTAYLTGQRALTLADALNAVKESVSSGWMKTFRLIFGDLTDAMNLFTGACNKVIDAISGIAEARNIILEQWANGGRDSLISLIFGEMKDVNGNVLYEGAYGIIDILEDVGKIIQDAFWEFVKSFVPTEFLTTGEQGLENWADNEEFRIWYLGERIKEITNNVKNAIASVGTWLNEVPEGEVKTRMQIISDIVLAVFHTVAFVANVIGGILYFFGRVREKLSPSIKAVSDLLRQIAGSITEAEEESRGNNTIIRFFEDLITVLQPAFDIINMVVESLAGLVSNMIIGEKANGTFGKGIGKVADVLKTLWKIVTDIARPFARFFSDMTDILGMLFRNGFDDRSTEFAKQQITRAFNRLWESLKTVIAEAYDTYLKPALEGIFSRISAYFADETTVGHQILEAIKSVVLPIWNFLSEKISAIVGFFQHIRDDIQGATLFDMLKLLIGTMSARNVMGKITELIKSGGLYKILLGVLGVSTIYGIFQIAKAVKFIGRFFEDVGGNLKQGFVGDYEWFSDRILKLAETISLLVACVAVMGIMDTGRMIQGIIGLGAVMAELGAFYYFMGKQKATWTQQTAMTATFAALAASIAILTTALIPFIVTDWGGMLRAVIGLGAILAGLYGFMYFTSTHQLFTSVHLQSFIGFAASISLLMLSLIPLMVTDWGGFVRAIAGLGLVFAEIIGFMEIAKRLKLFKKVELTGFIGFAASISILMLSLVPLALMDWGGFARAILGLGLVMAEIIGFMEISKRLNLFTSIDLGGFIGFAASVTILMWSLLPLALMDWEGFARAILGLGAVMAEIIGFMEISKRLNLFTDIHLGGFIAFAASITVLMWSLMPLALMSWGGFARAILGLGLVLTELGAFMEVAKHLKLFKKVELTGFILFAASISILMLSLVPLALMQWDQFIRGILGLGFVLAELIGFMELAKRGNVYTDINLGGFIAFAASVAILMVAMQSFALMSTEGYLQAIGGLTAILGELYLFMMGISAIPSNPTALLTVVAIATSVSLLAVLLSVALNEVRNIRWEVITAFTAGLTALIVGMASALLIVSAIPVSVGWKGLAMLAAGLAIVLGELVIFIPALISAIGFSVTDFSSRLELITGMLINFTDRMDELSTKPYQRYIDAFDKIRTMAKVMGTWGKYTGDLDNFAYCMFVLGTGVEIFNNHVGSAVTDLEGNTQAALKFIQDLSGCAGNLKTIEKMNMDALTSRISGLGGAMYIFGKGAKEAAGIEIGETPDVEGAMRILEAVSTGLTKNGGFTIPSNMPDTEAMGVFGAQLAAIAAALVAFEEAGSGLGTGTENALRTLAFFQELKTALVATEFAKDLGKTIGIFKSEGSEVTKEELSTFGTNIEQLGLALKKFANSTSIIDKATGEMKDVNYDNALKALGTFVELRSKLGIEFGPLIQFFYGKNKDLTDLATQIEALGTGLSDFINKVGGVDENGNYKLDAKMFDDAVYICELLTTELIRLSDKMGRVGGLISIISSTLTGRDYTFTDLKQQLIDLGEGLAAVGKVKQDGQIITKEEADDIWTLLDSVTTYLTKLGQENDRVGGIWNHIVTAVTGRKFDFTDLKEQLIALGEGLTGLTGFKAADIITKEEAENVYPVIDSLIAYMNTLHTKVGDKDDNTNDTTIGGLYNIVNTALNGRKFDFTDLKTQLTALGDGLSSLSSVTIDAEGKTIFNTAGLESVETTIDSLLKFQTKMQAELPQVGGLNNWFDTFKNGRETTFEDIGKNLEWLGTGLSSLSKSLGENGGFKADLVNSALGAIDSMVSILLHMNAIYDSLYEVGGLDDQLMFELPYRLYHISDYVNEIAMFVDYLVNGGELDSLVHDSQTGLDVVAQGGTVTDQLIPNLVQFIKNFDETLDELGGLKNTNSAMILDNVTKAIVNLVGAVKRAENEDGTFVDFSVIGTQMCAGIIQGIQNGTEGVMIAAAAMAKAAYDAACAALSINSPSKVFAEIGLSVGEGFVKGINNSDRSVENAAGELAETSIDGAGSALANFAALMAQDIDVNPTITPVLDLTNISAGSEEIARMLGAGFGIGVDGFTVSPPRTVEQDYVPPKDYSGDISRVNQEITSMRDDIKTLSDSISHLRMVVNTGALVGAIGPDMDQYLGRSGFYSERTSIT